MGQRTPLNVSGQLAHTAREADLILLLPKLHLAGSKLRTTESPASASSRWRGVALASEARALPPAAALPDQS